MRIKAVVVVSLFLAAVVIHFVPAQAGDGYEKYIEWYSDATKTEVVGWRHQYCGGTADSEGYQTSYREQWLIGECVDGGSWNGTICNYQAGYLCPAYCSACI